MLVSIRSFTLLLNLATIHTVSVQGSCNSSTLNTTIGPWLVTSNDNIFSIASATNRSVCAIARANRMSDPTLMNAGQTLLIPAQSCDAEANDSVSCLIPTNKTYTGACINGGLHTYNTRTNDTRTIIAAKFEVSVDSISALGSDDTAADEVLAADQDLKIPQCSPSQCILTPFKFVYGTYVDLAAQYNTTVGQIMALNPSYNYSAETDPTQGPVISLPVNCTALSSNVTVIS